MFTLYTLGGGWYGCASELHHKTHSEGGKTWVGVHQDVALHRPTGPQKPTAGVCSFSTFTVRDFKNKPKK